MCPRASTLARLAAGVALLIAFAGRGASAAPVAVQSYASWTTKSTLTLRAPRSGTLSIEGVAGLYLVVAVTISDTDHQVSAVTWTSTGPGAPSQALTPYSRRDTFTPGLACRSELWGLAAPAIGPGYVQVTATARTVGVPDPTLTVSLISFANVGATSTDGPCCMNASNDGGGTSTISKTMVGTSRGDMLVNAVCTTWTGAGPGTPGPDPANDPEMVPRTFVTSSAPNMQHFTGTSPGANNVRPATGSRTLRWLQTGSRSWAIVGLELLAADDVPDGAAPSAPDAGPIVPVPAPVDAGTARADAAVAAPPDAAVTAIPDAAAPDAAVPVGREIRDAGAAPGPADVAPRGRGDAAAAAPDDQADAGREQRQVDLQVGCACRTGRTTGGPGWAWLALLVAALRRRARR